jgi:hypothetical protein
MRKIIVLALFLVASGCGERDPNYENLKQLDGAARLAQFELLSLDERFRLYNKIYDKSGHPHDVELSVGFKDRPAESLNRIITDLNSSEFPDFLRYLPVIYNIGKRSDLDICTPRYIGKLKEILASYNLSPAQIKALNGLRFHRCQLP